MNRVVITGAGTINALAHDVPGTYQAFREGRCGITDLDIRDKDRLSIQIGGQVHNWDPEVHFNRQQIVLYDKFTQFTLLAARQAVARVSCWAPPAEASTHGMKTTAPSMKRGRTASIPSWCPS